MMVSITRSAEEGWSPVVKPVNGVWPPEQQTITDPTGTGGLVTPRTAAWVALARLDARRD